MAYTSEVRIALAGDWGTGTDEAAKVGDQIEAYGPHYAIHLGDVYYIGDPVEVGANFLGIPNPRHPYYSPCRWPNGTEGAFALNGKHEMYARGFGYFDKSCPSSECAAIRAASAQAISASRTTTGASLRSIPATIPSGGRL